MDLGSDNNDDSPAFPTRTDSDSDSDSSDLDEVDFPTTHTADLISIKEKEEKEDNVILDYIVKHMQCPVCTANPIGTNIKNC